MKEPEEMSFDKGKDHLVKTILEIKDLFRPVLVSVHGYPDAGKTQLTMNVIDALYTNHKIFGMSCQCYDNLDNIMVHNPVPAFVLLEDLPGRYRALEHFITYFESSPNVSVYITRQPIKDLPLNELRKIYSENYDVIIENPQAREKNGNKKSAEHKIVEQCLINLCGKK